MVHMTEEELARRQAARLPLAKRRAEEKLRTLPANGNANRLVRASQRTAGVAQRVRWLQKAATAWGTPISEVAACRKGCTHCCHIPVTISTQEAKLITAATGRTAQPLLRPVRMQQLTNADHRAAASEQLQRWGTGTACSFLADNLCTIYAVRPIACRVLFNLDDDDLLCRHGSAKPAEVPYADSRMIRALALAAQPAETLGDIRDFFPPTAAS